MGKKKDEKKISLPNIKKTVMVSIDKNNGVIHKKTNVEIVKTDKELTSELIEYGSLEDDDGFFEEKKK